MTKIKNFRIAVRPREIARWLKAHRPLQITRELEAAIEHAAAGAKGRIEPAALYTTLTRPVAEKATPVALPENAVALSLLAASIGPALEQERLKAEARKDTLREALWAGLQQEALTQAVQFAVRLIQEQAKEEDCEMSPPVSVNDMSLAASLAALLGVGRIGIEWKASDSLPPSYVRVAWAFWTPAAKKSSRPAVSSAV